MSFALALVVLCSGVCQAIPADETLNFYLSKSHQAFAAVIVNEPVKLERSPLGELMPKGTTVLMCNVHVTEHFHHPDGHPGGKEMTVYVQRPEDQHDQQPLALKKGQKCIFFVNWTYVFRGGRVTSDPWFGVQPYNATMAYRLRMQGKRPDPKQIP